jgi:hypothetical protein
MLERELLIPTGLLRETLAMTFFSRLPLIHLFRFLQSGLSSVPEYAGLPHKKLATTRMGPHLDNSFA